MTSLTLLARIYILTLSCGQGQGEAFYTLVSSLRETLRGKSYSRHPHGRLYLFVVYVCRYVCVYVCMYGGVSAWTCVCVSVYA